MAKKFNYADKISLRDYLRLAAMYFALPEDSSTTLKDNVQKLLKLDELMTHKFLADLNKLVQGYKNSSDPDLKKIPQLGFYSLRLMQDLGLISPQIARILWQRLVVEGGRPCDQTIRPAIHGNQLAQINWQDVYVRVANGHTKIRTIYTALGIKNPSLGS